MNEVLLNTLPSSIVFPVICQSIKSLIFGHSTHFHTVRYIGIFNWGSSRMTRVTFPVKSATFTGIQLSLFPCKPIKVRKKFAAFGLFSGSKLQQLLMVIHIPFVIQLASRKPTPRSPSLSARSRLGIEPGGRPRTLSTPAKSSRR